VYPAEVAGAYEMLTPDRIELAPPYPGLAGVRWSIPLPPGVVRTTARGAEAFGGERWRGWYERPWTGGVMRYRRPKRAARA
jgi:hypothetical protein